MNEKQIDRLITTMSQLRSEGRRLARRGNHRGARLKYLEAYELSKDLLTLKGH